MRLTKMVLQSHDAHKAGKHYDLRLKYLNKNSLASWALVRAEIPQKPGDKVLAVRTSDHDMMWLNFSGTIPRGQGGAGKVKIEQSGIAEILAWNNNIISFRVDGPVLKGKYALIMYKRSKQQTSWLLVKGKDN